MTLYVVSDPFSPKCVRDVAKQVLQQHPDSTLNYTGGTKVMSAVSFLVWGSKQNPLVYLEDRGGMFHWDLADDLDPLTAEATIKEILKLHGWDIHEDRPYPPVTDRDLQCRFSAPPRDFNWIRHVARQDELGQYQLLCENFDTQWARGLECLVPDSWQTWLEHAPLPISPQDYYRGGGLLPATSALYQQLHFLAGSYLEAIVHRAIEMCQVDEVMTSVFVKQADGSGVSEIDALVRVGRRLYLFSVTTNDQLKMAKQKAFEARQRATQLGGDLAGFAVASLLRPHLRESLKRSIGHPGFQAFSRSDVDNWMAGQVGDLRRFLGTH